MTDKEAMKLALEALEWSKPHEDAAITHNEAITALKERLAQSEQEPDYKLLFGELAEKFALLLDEKKMWKKQALFCFDVTAPPLRTERNFCSRCGKRTPDLTHIHTCTPPPQGNT